MGLKLTGTFPWLSKPQTGSLTVE
uniref:Uncharacterized protein n=1 Tax=Anguilla anguilla TaxID=7936 RepID=A0A0E9QUV2_ANGAN